VYTAGAAQLAALRQQKVLRQEHTVAQALGAQQVWQDLVAYRTKADALFQAHAAGDARVLATARQLYQQRNYLDAYRALATLA
jgi:hypothetical protein